MDELSAKQQFFLKHFGICVTKDANREGVYWIIKLTPAGIMRSMSYLKDLWVIWGFFEELVAKKVTVLAKCETADSRVLEEVKETIKEGSNAPT